MGLQYVKLRNKIQVRNWHLCLEPDITQHIINVYVFSRIGPYRTDTLSLIGLDDRFMDFMKQSIWEDLHNDPCMLLYKLKAMEHDLLGILHDSSHQPVVEDGVVWAKTELLQWMKLRHHLIWHGLGKRTRITFCTPDNLYQVVSDSIQVYQRLRDCGEMDLVFKMVVAGFRLLNPGSQTITLSDSVIDFLTTFGLRSRKVRLRPILVLETHEDIAYFRRLLKVTIQQTLREVRPLPSTPLKEKLVEFTHVLWDGFDLDQPSYARGANERGIARNYAKLGES
ncbi:hypothetical protein EIP86_002508 [Pleurotus ostreatoroseus]|nr:hypothetical protein EIP86_002508 [Pleurotus ostreatoroseus]